MGVVMEHVRLKKDGAFSEDWQGSLSFDRYTLYYATAQQPLKDETKEWIIRGLMKAQPSLKLAEYFRVKRNWFSEYDYLIVAVEDDTGDIIGALASKWYVSDGNPFFLHIIIQMIATWYERTNLLKHMWKFHFQKVNEGPFGFPSVIALRTCNPVVFTAMRLFSRIEGIKMYPQIGVETQDPQMAELARDITEQICPGLRICLDTGVIENASVPPDFYPSLPKANKPDVYNWFKNNLTVADRILCVLLVPTESARRKLLKAFGA
jgi:hypothetical protein